MASTYDSSGNPARLVVDFGVTGNSSGSNGIYLYESSIASSIIAASTNAAFFVGAGGGSRSPNNIGMRLRDIVFCRETSAGNSPGKVTIHSVIASTADQASTSASTGYFAGLNVSLSTFGITTN